MTMLGNHVDGGFAEFVKVPAKDLVPLPKEIDVTDASIVADAVTTGYHAAVRRADLRPGDKVAIFGCGGVGLSTMQFAAIAGAHVIAVDVDEKKLSLAKQIGAAEVVNAAAEKDVAKAIRKMTGGGVDRAIECIGKPATIQQGHLSLRVGGRLVIVGYCDKPVEMVVAKVMFQEQEVIGSLGCRPGDFPRVIDLVRTGKFRLAPLITGKRPLAEIGAAMDDLRAGRSVRTVIVPGK
jgi:2-desacetyl-2-hydroxyethyl bacteriochlorophyllide A dehydrogenase